MNVSLLVPFRPEKGPIGKSRRDNWKWIKQRWEQHFPEAEIVIGKDDGKNPFSKSQAVNDAYSRATGDVFVIADADSWVDMPQLVTGLRYAADMGVLVVPWTTAYRLSTNDTREILKIDPATPNVVTHDRKKRADDFRPSPATAAMLIIITREAFERVGGMDPRFRGWGAEDVCFGLSCGTLLGRTHIMPGEGYALHHERPRAENGMRIWQDDPGLHNVELADRYWQALGKPNAMLELCREHTLAGAIHPVAISPRQAARPVDTFVPELIPGMEQPPQVLARDFLEGEAFRDGDRIAL